MIMLYDQARTVIFHRQLFFVVLVRIQVGPPIFSKTYTTCPEPTTRLVPVHCADVLAQSASET